MKAKQRLQTFFAHQHVLTFFFFFFYFMLQKCAQRLCNISALQNATAVPCGFILNAPSGELMVTFTFFFFWQGSLV